MEFRKFRNDYKKISEINLNSTVHIGEYILKY